MVFWWKKMNFKIIMSKISESGGFFQFQFFNLQTNKCYQYEVFRWGTYLCHFFHLFVSLLHTISQNLTSSYHNFWHTCVKWWYLLAFFSFFWNFDFFGLLGGKRTKIAQNEKYKLHVSCVISQEQQSIWSWFLVHLCKMTISPGVFFIFWNFYFSDC